MSQTFYLKEKDQSLTVLTPVRLAIHVPCTILEAHDEHHHLYHLYFEDQQFLAAKKVSRSKRRSYTEEAFTQGIVFLCPHPLAEQLAEPESTLTNRTFTALLKKIEDNPLKAVEIFSCFDGLIKEEKLFKVLRDHYYTYKRDGKFQKATIIYERIKAIYPDHEWVQSIRPDKMDFSKDRRKLWEERKLTDNFSVQYQLAAAEEEYRSKPSPGTFQTLSAFTGSHYSSSQAQLLFERLLADGFDEPARNSFKEFIRNEQPAEALQILVTHPFKLKASDVRDVRALLQDQDNLAELSLEDLCKKLSPLLSDHPEELNQIILSALKNTANRDIHDLEKQLKPVAHLPVFKIVSQLTEIAEDPEQQAKAGFLYKEIGFYHEAIDCFSYEMELNPESREPVEQLSQTYLAAGLTHESKTYQQLLKTMVS
ncbi:hypothetical protein E2626_13060 [Jeotgalibacillus salarius]|uniref:Uncharacterized protein n=2 Tax=Jeotgalibacillus salarius TaxID=546023 RepID=A0A4Y8LC12_9BACL|nr:hypothetical protein E2626_13060 [Jeotgalibacillus salarius]